MAEVLLKRSRIDALICQLEPGGMASHQALDLGPRRGAVPLERGGVAAATR